MNEEQWERQDVLEPVCRRCNGEGWVPVVTAGDELAEAPCVMCAPEGIRFI